MLFTKSGSCLHISISDIKSPNRQLEELQKRVDLTLHTHIVNRDVQYLQFSFRFNCKINYCSPVTIFRWMNNLLLRELPLNATIRLWDTYLAEPDGFRWFYQYFCDLQTLSKNSAVSSISTCALLSWNAGSLSWNKRKTSRAFFSSFRYRLSISSIRNILNQCPVYCHDQ